MGGIFLIQKICSHNDISYLQKLFKRKKEIKFIKFVACPTNIQSKLLKNAFNKLEGDEV